MQPLSDHFTNVPAFLTKLWKMVSDPKTDHLICWSPSGNSFIILNQVQFWYELLPLYYKHNNMSSFVRQLNMYGFHKVSSVENGSMVDGEKEEVQFFHTYFQKGSPELLKLIKRKVTVSKHSENGNQMLKNEDLSKVLNDVKQLRGRQANVDSQLAAMKQENAVLWRELAVLRQKHSKQQQIVNKLIQFLVSMVHPGNNRVGVGVKRQYPLMLRASPSKRSRSSRNNSNNNNNHKNGKNDGPTIHELDNELELENDLEPEVLLSTQDDIDKDIPLIYSPLTPSSSTHSLGVVSPISNIDLTNELINETETSSGDKLTDENSSPKNAKDSYWDKTSYIFGQNDENQGSTSSGGNSVASGDDGTANELLADTRDPILEMFEDNIMNDEKKKRKRGSDSKIFINKTSQDALLSNLSNGNFTMEILKNTDDNSNAGPQTSQEKPSVEIVEQQHDDQNNTGAVEMAIANRTTNGDSKISNSGDFGVILDNNQSEIDLYKEILHDCGTFDTNALLGEVVNRMPLSLPDYKLFNEGALEYGFSFSQDGEQHQITGDPMVSGQEVTNYSIIPLDDLLDDSLNNAEISADILNDNLSQLNTPQISDVKPEFTLEKSE